MRQFKTLGILLVTVVFSLLLSIAQANAIAVDSAGKVIATEGKVTATDQEENVRPIKRGDSFFVEDTIITDLKSNVSLQFSDGALLELKENSVYKIKDYNYDKNAVEKDSFFAELIKGGFRSITGILGKRSPENYAIKARMTTLTVRGTKLMMDITDDNNVQAGVLDGQVVLLVGDRSQDLSAGQSAAIGADGEITVSNFIPKNMMNGYSNQNINHLLQQAKEAALTPQGNAETQYIEGEGKQKPKKPIGVPGGESPCEGVSQMSGAM